jgi:type VI secretion system protein ImpL
MKTASLLNLLPIAILLMGIALLIVLIIGLVLFLLWRTKKKQKVQPQESDAPEASESETQPHQPAVSADAAETQPSVASAVEFLDQNSSGRGSGYGTPWFLVLGATGSGKSTLLDHSGISLSLREGAADFGVSQGIKWRFFDAGVILDVPGDFFLGADKTASDEQSWKELLRNLLKHRPQRPIDGVVLTIPCDELTGNAAISPALIGQRAAHIFDKLWQIQKWLGFCFPVYVVVTKCDQIPGFMSLVQQLPAHYKREMFGWSNPYNLEAAFDSSWVDQGFDEIARDVHRLQSEVLVERHNIANVDDLFLFSSGLQELRKPLRIYLGQILKQSAYRESLQFRGFYFAGDATEMAEEKPQPARAMGAAASYSGASRSYLEMTGDILGLTKSSKTSAQHAPVFVTDLFEAKIFPERALARPVTRVRLSNNRWILGTQAGCLIATLVLALGVTFGYHRLAESQAEGVEGLRRISDRLKATSSSTHRELDTETTLAPLNVMEHLTGHDHFRSVFIPSSIVFSVDERVIAAMRPAFKNILYQDLRDRLISNAQDLFHEQVTAGASDEHTSTMVVSIKSTPTYQKLHEFTDRLLHLEENIARYNKIAQHGGGDAESLLALARYGNGDRFGGDFDAILKQHDSYLTELVIETSGKAINVSDVVSPQQARTRMEEYVRDVFDEWLPSDGLNYLDDMAKQLNAFDRQELHTYAQLNDLKASLTQAEQLLISPEFAWINQGKVDIIAPLQDTMDRITLRPVEKQLFLCSTVSAGEEVCPQLEGLKAFIDKTGQQDLATFKKALLATKSGVTEELLDSHSDVLRLSPNSTTVLNLLNILLKLPFVGREGTGTIPANLDRHQQLFWQKDELQAAIQYEKSFQDFLKGEFEAAPPNIQEAVEGAALNLLEQNMVDVVEHAEHIQPLPSSSSPDQMIAPEVQSFQDASPSLNIILSAFEELNFNEAHSALQSLTMKQATHLLLRIDDSFEAQKPYANDIHFERWDGEEIPSRAGFDIHNPDQMTQYLAYQRQQAEQYAAQAAPVVSFLEGQSPRGGNESGRAFLKWQQIIADLQKYQAKVPGTSVAALEDFLGSQIDKATPENCQAGFLATAAQGGSYFVQVRESLRHALFNRCRSLSAQNAVRAYGQIAQLFNLRLAGKFPFSPPPQEQLPSEADPQDVAELFRLVDTYGKSIHNGLQSGSFGDSYSQVLTFLNQLEGLRPLFNPLLSAESDPVPVFDFVPFFRVNQGREINGNQIIDWTLQVGNDTFRYREPQRIGRWSYGEPVKLILRWAKDSPQQPLSATTPVDSKLSSRSVVFEYRDSWALFTMMALHQPGATDFDRMADPDPQTLVFTINDGKSSDSTTAGATPNLQAKVFVRIKLRPPGKPDNLRVRAFPLEAPPLEQGKAEARTSSRGGDSQ